MTFTPTTDRKNLENKYLRSFKKAVIFCTLLNDQLNLIAESIFLMSFCDFLGNFCHFISFVRDHLHTLTSSLRGGVFEIHDKIIHDEEGVRRIMTSYSVGIIRFAIS